MTKLIGLAGFAQVGKTSIADVLYQDRGFREVSFAAPLKELLALIDPLVFYKDGSGLVRYSSVLEHQTLEWAKKHTDARDYLIRLGDGARRTLGQTVWVDAAMARVDRLMEKRTPVIVADVRYPNEADAILRRGGEVWLVQREGVEPAHPTEAESVAALVHRPGVNRVIHNDGNLHELRDQVLAIVDSKE